jgi:protein SCO1
MTDRYFTGVADVHEGYNVRKARWPRVWATLCALTLVATACSSGPPGPPPASAGTVETRAIPAAIRRASLVNQRGQTVTLASFRGRTVLLVPFLTLCNTICPLTTGNLLQTELALKAAGLNDRVQIVELSVDPGRDNPARLTAYAHLTGATWDLVTESPTELARFARFFGFSYRIAPPGHPPPIDWLTGKPLTYVVDHSVGYYLINSRGTLRYSTAAAPDFTGTLNPKLRAFLNKQGRDHLTHPEKNGWTVNDALSSLSWLLGQRIP